MTDYRTIYLSNLTTADSAAEALWLTEYSFTEAYGKSGYSLSTAAQVYMQLGQNSGYKNNYIEYYDLKAPPVAISSSDWKAYHTGTGYAGVDNFVKAYCGD